MSAAPHVTLRQLRLFLTVARTGSFSRAGGEIGLTQSAVSRAIRELEDELELRLFDRTTRDVQLSAVGEELSAHLSRLLDELDEVLREVSGLGAQRRGRVIVAASPTLAARLLPACVARCAQRYPLVQWILKDEVQSDVIAHVRSGEVDFGVVVGPFEADDMIVDALRTDTFVAVLRADHPLAERAALHWRDLDGQTLALLDHSSGSRPIIDRLMAQAGVAPRAVHDLAYSATVFGMVEAGLGMSVLPALSLPLPAGMPLCALPLEPVAYR